MQDSLRTRSTKPIHLVGNPWCFIPFPGGPGVHSASQLSQNATPQGDFCPWLDHRTHLDSPDGSFPSSKHMFFKDISHIPSVASERICRENTFTSIITHSRLWVPSLKLNLSFSWFRLQWALTKIWPPSSRIKASGVSKLSSCSYEGRFWQAKCKTIRVQRI